MKGVDGLLIGASILAGIMMGPEALLVVIPVLVLLEFAQSQLRWRLIAIVVLGVVLGAFRVTMIPEVVDIDDLANSRAAEGIVASMPMASGTSERTIVTIDRLQRSDQTWIGAGGRVLVYLPDSGEEVNIGDRISMTWHATPVGQLAPGYAGYLESRGVSGSARVVTVRVELPANSWMRYLTNARRVVGAMLQDAIPGDTGALAAGIVTGDDSGLSTEAQLWFRQTGTTHITAVSGQNVALLTGFLGIWFRPGRRSTRWLVHGGMLIAIWLYVGMVGLEAPALRAAIVASLMMSGSWVGRRPDPVTILALTLGIMALIDPAMTRQIGFLLSASAAWGLCASVRLRAHPAVMGGIWDVAIAVMAANIATLPILLFTFGEWSPTSLLANLLLGPIMTIAFPASYLLAGAGFLMPGAVAWLAWIPAIPLDFALDIVHRLSSVAPMVHLPVVAPGMALLIALPCLSLLLVLGHDGERWLRRLFYGWSDVDGRIWMLVAGIGTGCALGLIGFRGFW